MKNPVKDKACFLVCSLYLIYIVVQGVCLIFAGDDFIWFQSQSLKEYFGNYAVNGRYFTNLLTYLIVKYAALRVIVYTIVHALLFFCTAKLISRGKQNRWAAYAFVAAAMFSMEPAILRQTTSWISGFTNYYGAALFSVLYLNLCFASIRGEQRLSRRYTFGYAAVIGFLGALCLETATILNLLLAFVFLAEMWIRRKKLSALHLVYLVSAVAGACIMFVNRNYSRFAAGQEDEFGARFIDFSFFDIMTTLYRNFVEFYISPYAFLNLVIAAALGILYYKTYYAENKRPPKYGKAAMLLVICYAAYSVLSQHLEAFAAVSVQYRTQSIEAGMMFLFAISLLYLAWHLTDRAVFHRFTLCCAASAISVLPFLVVDPVNPRCFFCGYIFWMLAAGTVGAAAWSRLHIGNRAASAIRVCAGAGIGVYAGIFCCLLILNKYCDSIRIRYIQEQLDRNANILQVVELPYPNIQKDYLTQFLTEGASGEDDIWRYDEALRDYYGFSEMIDMNTPHQFISLYSYSMTTD